jgi:hypothetical protein
MPLLPVSKFHIGENETAALIACSRFKIGARVSNNHEPTQRLGSEWFVWPHQKVQDGSGSRFMLVQQMPQHKDEGFGDEVLVLPPRC